MNDKLCGCCEGVEIVTPEPIANRPGLEALAYRVGIHATFLETMQARLSTLRLKQEEEVELDPLHRLTTRDTGDPAMALLDAWASVADVLTFYQERIANEGYLRTATERRSILELARLVGYRLRPGVAASVYLAFTLEQDRAVEIPAVTRAQSLPGPGQRPQPFETAEPLPARAEWSQIQPRQTRPQYITNENADEIKIIHKTLNPDLKPGDPLLFIFGDDEGEQVCRKVEAIEVQAEHNRVKVMLQQAGDGTQAADALIKTVQEEMKPLIDLNANEVAGSTTATNIVMPVLKKLVGLKPELPLQQLIRKIVEKICYLKGVQDALGSRAQNLSIWIEKITTSLANTVAKSVVSSNLDVNSLAGIGDPTDMLGRSFEKGYETAFKALGEVSDKLQRKPSPQPANRHRLPRSLQTSFAEQADVFPKLLAHFQPDVAEKLYDAWSKVTVGGPAPLQGIEAARIKAAPFGHNLPPKPIRNAKGAIVDYQEWPLGEAITINMHLFQESDGIINVSADLRTFNKVYLSIRKGKESDRWQDQLPLQDSNTVKLVNGKVIITALTQDNTLTGGYIFEFFIGDWKRTIQVEPSVIGTAVSINDKVYQVLPGEVDNSSANGHRVRIAYEEGTLSISETTALPPKNRNVILLDREYDQITPGCRVAIERPVGNPRGVEYIVSEVTGVQTVVKDGGRYTSLILNDDYLKEEDRWATDRAGDTIYIFGEPVTMVEEPIEKEVGGEKILLDGLYDGLEAGRWLIISGERTDIPVRASELVMLAGVSQVVEQLLTGDTVHTLIELANELAYTYKRDTVTIYGNVVKATHGETRQQVLGSGDGSQARQQFSLAQSPLTYLAAPIPAGAESSLEVRVNGVRWHEAEHLFDRGPTDRVYLSRADDEDKATLTFGDGQHGARLPTGVENVSARYRTGIGRPGNVAARQISLLATRPLGVKGVLNPLPATGGADRESRDQARRNAPLAVMALDRLVSVQDYADFARTFAGIGKASVVRLNDGRRQVVHLTIAGAGDIPIDDTSDLYLNLVQALHQLGDPYLPVRVDVRELMVLVVSAGVRLLPDYQWESVEPKIRAVLLETFSFEQRQLGQDVVLSEVISTIQAVEGVAYVDLDAFGGIPEKKEDEDRPLTPAEIFERVNEMVEKSMQAGKPEPRIRVNLADLNKSGGIRPAQLAYLTPDIPETLSLTELT